MKKLIICLLLIILTACAHNKPAASPKEVNDYLNGLAHRAADHGYACAFEGTGEAEMHGRLTEILRE